MDIIKTLLEFSACTGTPGMENEAAVYGERLMSAYGKVERTPLGSLICVVQAPAEGQPHIMLDAHMDEIGMVVTFITHDGFLRVAPCGGVDRRLLLASPVTVHARGGKITGVVCSIPPHLSSGDEKNKKVEEIYIDMGFSKEECEKRVSAGDRVTLGYAGQELLNGFVSGKALDNRAGCTALLTALEYLGDVPPGLGLSVVLSSMEEVGLQGAKTAAYALSPTHAIVVDVSYAHTPDSPREKCGIIGKGPMIGFAPILTHRLSDKLVELAKAAGIEYQTEVMGGKTGTNADAVAVSRGGVQTALVSIPQKYMHTPIETVSVCDVENTGRLIAELIKNLSRKGI